MARRRRLAPNNLPRARHWTDDARCRTDAPNALDPNVFYADDDPSIREAKAFCVPCAVREECLVGALERREPAGVWGGLSAVERRAILAARRRAAERRQQAERRAAAETAAAELQAREVSCAVPANAAA